MKRFQRGVTSIDLGLLLLLIAAVAILVPMALPDQFAALLR